MSAGLRLENQTDRCAESEASTSQGVPPTQNHTGPVTEPIRVFHLIKSLGRGGAETLLPETLRHSDARRFQYRYGYFLPWKTAMVASLEAEGSEVDCFHARSNAAILGAARRVARAVKAWRADILHCHLPMAGIVGRVAGKLSGVPVVYTEHNLLERYHPITRILSLASWRWQKKVFAVSADVADSIRRRAPAQVPVQVLLNGVDVNRFNAVDGGGADVRTRYGIPLGAPVIGTVAVFREQKRLDQWLDAASIIIERRPEAHFILVGDGPLREELRERVDALGLNSAVHWTGLQDDVRPFLSAMNVFMISSRFEGLPIALLEAMSMKCAVVATSVGGIPEVVHEGSTGILVQPGNPNELAGAVGRLIASPEMLEVLGRNGRELVERSFSIRRMTEELEATYEELLKPARNG